MGNWNIKARMKTVASKGIYWLKLGLGMRVAADIKLAWKLPYGPAWVASTNRLTWLIFADSLYGVVGM